MNTAKDSRGIFQRLGSLHTKGAFGYSDGIMPNFELQNSFGFAPSKQVRGFAVSGLKNQHPFG